MPTYEYECTRCGHLFEEFKPMSSPRRQRCPLCRGKVERLISGGLGVHFKGSGFYITDSRGTNKVDQPAAPVSDTKSPTLREPATKADSPVKDQPK